MYLEHLRIWWTRILGVRVLDARYMGLPRYAGQQHFASGLSALTQWQGNEARATARSFLGIVAGSRVREAVQAARCIMDFLYRARMPQLDDEDLAALDADLQRFHAVKEIFVTEGVQDSPYGFNNIAKLHILRHYSHMTREMGTPDGYTTETPERLHKDYVKASYNASNGIVPEPQMLTHLRRQEAWQLLRMKYEREGLVEKRKRRGRPGEEPIDDEGIDEDIVEEDWGDEERIDEEWVEEGELGDGNGARMRLDDNARLFEVGQAREREAFQFASRTQIAKRPLHVTSSWNHTPLFLSTVKAFVRELDSNLAFHLNNNTHFRIWSKFSIRHDPLPFAPLVGDRIDLVRAALARHTSAGQITRPAVSDTVLIEAYPEMIGLLRKYLGFLPTVFR